MSFRVNARKKKDGTTYWRLLTETWENNKRTDRHIPTDQLQQHGFIPSMSVEEAKARAKQLNASGRLDKQKMAALRSHKQRGLIKSAHLPETLTEEFRVYLRKRVETGPRGAEKWKKAQSHWSYVQKLVAAIELPPSRWEEEARAIYNYLAKQRTSRFYASKVLSVLNLWGVFLARKTGQSFIPVPPPKGYDRELIVDAYSDSGKKSKESLPLSPEALEAARSRFPVEQYNWLVLSVWFGLRPTEVDGLGKVGRYRLDMADPSGVPVLWVYQTKLAGNGVPREKRWKAIPCVYPEQVAALQLIGKHKRPLVKTVQSYIAKGINLYGGRKGFTDMMLGLGQGLEDISSWLGHQTIETTWKSYKQKQKVSFRKAS